MPLYSSGLGHGRLRKSYHCSKIRSITYKHGLFVAEVDARFPIPGSYSYRAGFSIVPGSTVALKEHNSI